MINSLWERAALNPADLTANEIQLLINDRLATVTDNLATVSPHTQNETIFDLIMLFFDSLNEKRQTILKLWDNIDFNQKLICQSQAQLITAIDCWHKELNLHWQIGGYLQNLLFLVALSYTATIWKTDTSADSSKVMAKVDEIIGWLNSSKSAPFDFLQKLKNIIV
jgi:hypothetical protein